MKLEMELIGMSFDDGDETRSYSLNNVADVVAIIDEIQWIAEYGWAFTTTDNPYTLLKIDNEIVYTFELSDLEYLQERDNSLWYTIGIDLMEDVYNADREAINEAIKTYNKEVCKNESSYMA